MSYELSGLGAARPPRLKLHRVKASKLPHPAAWTGQKRRARPHEFTSTLPRLPAHYAQASQLSGLGFSLKPPKWVRKLTIKKVIKPLAITAAIVGAAFIPGALPLVGKAAGMIAKGAVGAGRFALRSGRQIGGGFTSIFKKPAAAPQTTIPTAPESYQPPPPEPRPTGPSGTLGPSEQVPYSPPTYAPSEAAYGGGGGGAPQTGDSPAGAPPESNAPAAAGTGASSLVPIGVGLLALVAVSAALKRRRR
jgi:hypothetical protein